MYDYAKTATLIDPDADPKPNRTLTEGPAATKPWGGCCRADRNTAQDSLRSSCVDS